MPRIELEGLKPPARALDDFPPSFARLRRQYRDFEPKFEYRRDSFSRWLNSVIEHNGDATVTEVEAMLSRPPRGRPIPELLQRHFYWSATCFIRSYYLLLAYLTLDKRGIDSWARVTGYYSRFYAAKATCNLCLAGWIHVEPPTPSPIKKGLYLLYSGTNKVRLLPAQKTGSLYRRGSHQPWWTLYDQVRRVRDFPSTEAIQSGLHQYEFTAEERNELNYSERWMEGFPELEWFDSTEEQMEAHANFARPRRDQDFTDIDRFFEGYDPESSDQADFYTDSVQALWHPILAYLDLLDALPMQQDLLSYGKLISLTRRVIGPDYPNIARGMSSVLAARGKAL